MIARFSIIILLGAVFLSTQARAQTRPSLEVVIEDTDDNARKCGISDKSMLDAVSTALRENRVSIVADSNPFYVLNLNIIHPDLNKNCTYSVNVKIIYAKRGGQYGNFKTKSGDEIITLCIKDQMGFSLVPDTSRIVSGFIRDMTKACLSELTY